LPPANPIPPYICKQCGSSFFGRKRMHCSDACAVASKNEKDRLRKNAKRKKPYKKRRLPTPIINGMRQCLDCGTTKPLSDFAICSKAKTGYSSLCKSCDKVFVKNRRSKRTAEQRRAERERIAQKNGKTYNRRSQIKAESFESKQSDLAVINAYQAWRYWMEKAPDEWIKKYFEAKGKPWQNPRLSGAEKWKIQYNIDPEFNLKQRLRRQQKKKARRDGVAELIRGGLRRNGQSNTVESLLGYSISELRDHLEKQFTKGMSWEKYMAGKIHIDHIVPQSAFDLSDEKEWMACWAMTNLRPMWAKDNLAKTDKRMFLL
jgi:hypothetical protein